MAGFVERVIATRTIAVRQATSDWEAAVRLGGEMMKSAGLVEQSYIDAMVDNHKKIGPYYVLAPGIAMPHAKPEEGVRKTGYAVVTLAQPVSFGDPENDPVDLLIFAGAISREDHNEEVVPQVAELCDSESYVARLRGAPTVEAAISVLRDFERAFEAGEL
ncbi:PTS system, ascorbate-specific IIA component [Alkalispirochaeta americana]|uniref:Ascorbate-specific PTS system EIIA component n=1 Tax=Alkalispirochaeta americana TaxID=159291 RepID=A0A1N6Q7Y8_9SPIO|nr:PTS sugar transporter subunit IIA [Alkalispirochaeta americana]SIQ12649.1 PTS system, ascorbate-specific IIA component [Alkalispirochaeta americana]